MKRWFWKRWIWTGLFGVTAAVGLAVAAGGGKDAPAPAAPHKVGEVITLKFQNGPEKQVKVLKTERQPDGSFLAEVKDTKTGEVFTLLDKTALGPDNGKSAAASKDVKSSVPAKATVKSAEPSQSKAASKTPGTLPAMNAPAMNAPTMNASTPAAIKDTRAAAPPKPTVAAAPAP